jgi:hypothetical protein
MAELTLEGWAELKPRLQGIADKMVKSILDQSMRQAANVVKDAARSNFDRGDPYPNEISGWLRKSIRTVKRRGTPTRVVYNVVAGSEYVVEGSEKVRPSYALWVERGHLINPGNLGKADKAARQMAARVGNTSGMVKPHPFMQPAIEQNAQVAIDMLIIGISDRLPELVT